MQSGGKSRFALSLAGFAMLVVPLSIVLHELAHLITALALGFPNPIFHFNAVSPGDVSRQAQWELGAVGLAGPVVTALLAMTGIAAHRHRPHSAWPFALAIAAASRFAVAVPYSVGSLYVRLDGRRLVAPAFDEQKAADALGWAGERLLGLTSATVILVAVWLVVKLPNRRWSLPTAVTGLAAGWVLWMKILGPRLFP